MVPRRPQPRLTCTVVFLVGRDQLINGGAGLLKGIGVSTSVCTIVCGTMERAHRVADRSDLAGGAYAAPPWGITKR